MSNFNRLSQAIGTAVHKATKEANGNAKQRHIQVMATKGVHDAVKDLVEHTIKNTEDNERG